jgi:O-antigen ligase/polysaccharide polymerase Wzy-like membrane protein
MGPTAQSSADYRATDERPGSSIGVRASLSRIGLAPLLALPGGLTAYFAFNSGGIFEVTTAFGALAVLVAIVVCIAVAPRPLAGLAWRGLLACGLLALFALWTLLSTDWSHASGRALVACDRVLLYLAVLALFAGLPHSVERIRWISRGLLAGSAVVSIVALASRLLPALWPTRPGLVGARLSYPITYWNTLGLLVGVACVLAVHHASDEHEPRGVRVCAAALLPPLGATLLLTFSRGAIAVTALGILLYIALARPRGLLGAVLAVAPTAALGIARTYSAQLVQKGTPLTPAAIAQGHRLALTLGACSIAAAILRMPTLALDIRVTRILSSRRPSRRTRLAGGGVLGVAVLALFIAAHGPSFAHRQYEKFVNDTHVAPEAGGGQRGHLLYAGNDGRLPLWRVALDGFRRDPLRGTGAGTYRLQWERHPQRPYDRVYAYSLYLEVLGELGLVGAALLVASLLTIVVAIALRARGPGREVHAAALAVVLAWLLHAGVDIDWQTPAVCIFVFALGGLALAAPRDRRPPLVPSESRGRRRLLAPSGRWGPTWRWHEPLHAPAPALRPLIALGCLAVAVIPWRMALAQAHLREGIQALDAGACPRAQADAREAIAELDTGARPYEVLAMCAARRGDGRAAVSLAQVAVAHDPEDWEPHYVLALAEGTAGIDPRASFVVAYEADPLGPLPQEGMRALPRRGGPRRWRALARMLPFAFD